MTSHDPMLDGIARWAPYEVVYMKYGTRETVPANAIADDEGHYVLFSDLPALIARVREDERELLDDDVERALATVSSAMRRGYEQGQRDEREACIAAVEALPDWKFCDAVCGTEQSVIAAIRAREEKP